MAKGNGSQDKEIVGYGIDICYNMATSYATLNFDIPTTKDFKQPNLDQFQWKYLITCNHIPNQCWEFSLDNGATFAWLFIWSY